MITQAEFSGWGMKTGEWLIEGTGTIPDIEIDFDPASMIKGEDPQLDRGIKHVMDELQANPPKIPPPPRFPVRPVE
jgi:tricorn protease